MFGGLSGILQVLGALRKMCSKLNYKLLSNLPPARNFVCNAAGHVLSLVEQF
jgi:hypothetical protein